MTRITTNGGGETRRSLESRGAHALSLWRECFPAVFRDPPVPLAIGIFADLVALTAGEFGPAEVSAALRLWTRCREYREALAAGGPRYALDGAATGEVAEEHRTSAAQEATRPDKPPDPKPASLAATVPKAAAPPSKPLRTLAPAGAPGAKAPFATPATGVSARPRALSSAR